MAKNWMIPEVVTAMVEGDESAIQDFTKRNPLASNLIAKAISGDADAMVKFFMNVPEYLSLRKMESVLKEDVEPYEEDGKEKKPAKKAPKKENKEKADKADKKKEKPAKKEKKEKEVDGDIKSHPLYGLTKKAEVKDASTKDLMSFKKMAGISGKDWGKGKDDAIAAVIKWNKDNAKGKAKPKKDDKEEKPAKKDEKKGNKEKDTKKKSKKKEEVEDDDDDDEDWDF